MADLTAKNNTFRRLQKQAIVNPSVVDPPIVVPLGNNESKTIDHKFSPGLSTSSVNTSTNKHCLKLADSSIFTDGKNGVPVEH